jgi:hypothetical protein
MAFFRSAVLLSLVIVGFAVAVHVHAEANPGGLMADFISVLKAMFLPSTSSSASTAAAEAEVLSQQGGVVKCCSPT